MNVDPECEQSYRSSTSVKESELAAFEGFVCKRMEALVRGTFAGIYLEAANRCLDVGVRAHTGVASFNETNIRFDVMHTGFQSKRFCACCACGFHYFSLFIKMPVAREAGFFISK